MKIVLKSSTAPWHMENMGSTASSRDAEDMATVGHAYMQESLADTM